MCCVLCGLDPGITSWNIVFHALSDIGVTANSQLPVDVWLCVGIATSFQVKQSGVNVAVASGGGHRQSYNAQQLTSLTSHSTVTGSCCI
jgi:hypothetical protein